MYETSVQPKEGGAGLTDARLIAIAQQAGATNMGQISTAIKDQTFKNWVGQRTDEFVGELRVPQRRQVPGIAHRRPGTPTLDRQRAVLGRQDRLRQLRDERRRSDHHGDPDPDPDPSASK